MAKNMLALLAALALSGCYVIAPFPGGYIGFEVPPYDVNIATAVGTHVSIAWNLIPGTAIYYAPEYPGILYYGGYYYYVVNGVWYIGPRYNGPWRVLRDVPDVFLYIPPSHPAFHVVGWHPRYHTVYKTPPPVKYYGAGPPPVPPKASPPKPDEPVKGKPGKQDDESPPAPPPGPPGRFIRR